MTQNETGQAFRELDEVTIPSDIAEREGVVQHGTVVWYVDGAPYATIECAVLGSTGIGNNTKLIDIEVNLIMIK
jgi:hypothetical protein